MTFYADPPDQELAAHFGDPYAEQKALEGGEAAVRRSNRGVVRVSGPDRLSWLHSLLSQHLSELTPGSATEALLLSPNGHIEHHLQLVDDGSAVWAHVEPGTAADLAAFLDRMRFMLRVEVADVSGEYDVVTGAGLSGELSLPDVAGMTSLIVPAGAAVDGCSDAGIWAYEALRIASHKARLGVDTDHRTIPHEIGFIGSAVHLNKGCYRGQETVARVHNLGRPPRRLVFLHLDGSEDRLPGRGEPVLADGRQVGFVGSAARHHELGPIALALVKRTVPVEAALVVDGIAAAQEVIVSPDTGANVTIDPALRGRRR
ncbi:YgfZ/GcvT domain-containing protein [Actinocorallia sp. A-T 12471]|uniref:CAF17-like 4Fe-4S cluster assembly/insertion protein YgfZ n=1 Tax=Actinocorallia sp. A-T 12471 TaxID=3089813 RepID=UPI0029D3AC4D|nr:glycine cleavage T C-terminal barrel domain-containing protein [Actinocorallia sp. A-T 12471]MDX6738294.1 glycine cleavage T C-terminal barrel domain-containing protein [Actinocorallia sp. A-T 12471]